MAGVEIAGLVAERWGGEGLPLVLLHAGVCDLRSWRRVAEELGLPCVAYDRRGFGATPPADAPFRHLDDLYAVLDEVAGEEPVWLVGNSMGGALALDAALEAPERVAGLVLIAPAISGEPDEEPGELGEATERLDALLGATEDPEEVARLEAWLWLDGPAAPEGRVGGPARELALAMNRIIIANEAGEHADGDAGLDAWSRLEDIRAPTTVVWGAHELPFLVGRCELLAARLPAARTATLPASAHLPGLDDPAGLARVIRDAVT